MGVEIRPCVCPHEFQDKKYGKGQRVWNKCGAKNKDKIRCSVCARTV